MLNKTYSDGYNKKLNNLLKLHLLVVFTSLNTFVYFYKGKVITAVDILRNKSIKKFHRQHFIMLFWLNWLISDKRILLTKQE